MRASGNSMGELQAVIEKSVVLGLATNTASTSHSLAELVTTYASTLATQVLPGRFNSRWHGVVDMLASRMGAWQIVGLASKEGGWRCGRTGIKCGARGVAGALGPGLTCCDGLHS